MAIYDVNGTRVDQPAEKNLDYDANVISINHRGYSAVAPENTLPAYRLSKEMGFNYAEGDVSFTLDGIPMLLHDSTIDRTSNGTGTLSQMTFYQVRQYDFGSWKDPKYTGTKIPTLEEFLQLCKSIMLHPYIELKSNGNYTQAQIEQIVDMVSNTGLKGKVTYISFSSTFLGYVKTADPYARLGFLRTQSTTDDITVCQGLQTATNKVFYDTKYTYLTSEICEAFAAVDIPIEAYTLNSESAILALDKYVSGITSDSLIAGKVLYEDEMGLV